MNTATASASSSDDGAVDLPPRADRLPVLALLAMALAGTIPAALYAGVSVWGLAFGGTPALVQTASARVSGPSADVARSLVVTTWNAVIAGAGLLGGWLLDRAGPAVFPWVALGLLAMSMVVVLGARRHGGALFR